MREQFEVIDRMLAGNDPSMGGSGTKDFKAKAKRLKQEKKKKQKPAEERVTEHAMVRYFERVMGVNTDVVRKGLAKYANKEDGSYFLASGLYVVVRDGKVVTINKHNR